MLQYQLVDFGEGRKLERFGGNLIDRPAPAVANLSKATPELWPQADARYQRNELGEPSGTWNWSRPAEQVWTMKHGPLVFELRTGESGQVGVFPEQATNWDWIAGRLRAVAKAPRVLNLFAYTGGSSLAAAAVGAEVVHVDAARSAVQWARRNAELSRLAEAPVRWIVEDARRFAARECRRKSRYDAVILDPPSYGHGPRGQGWKIEKHLPDLLLDCARLTDDRCLFVLVSCHTPGFGAGELSTLVRRTFGDSGRIKTQSLALTAVDGRDLAAGKMVCWEA